MPSPDDLTQAGRRAAARPTPIPSISEIEGRAAQRRNRRRGALAASGLAVVIALVAGAVIFRDSGDQFNTVAGPAADVSRQDAAPSNTGEPDASGDLIGDEQGATSADDPLPGGSANIELHLADGLWLSADVVRGDEAAARAETAAAAADETREVGGSTVWIERDDDKAAVSALVEPELFVAITGPTNLLDRLVDALDSGVLIAPGLHFGEEIPDALKEFFGEGFPQGLDDFLGEGFDPERFDFGFDGLGEGFSTEAFGSLLQRFNFRLGELPFSLDDLPLVPSDIEGFLDNLGELGELWPDGHLGCFSVKAPGGDGDGVSLQIPEGCLDG